MCGIVGYIGQKKAQSILLGGLRRLEYRGYDSAGIATLDANGKKTLLREKGKVAALDRLVTAKKNSDTIGIGHTRWATHGAPSKRNAHPHCVGDIMLVHNGIIENYADLKELLEKRGYKFQSDTDSEVLAGLIDASYQSKKHTTLLNSVLDALQSVVGAYGIAVMTAQNPEEIVVARKGSPLILGINDDEVFIASDASALVGHTNQVVYLNDGEVALCHAGNVELCDIEANTLEPSVEKLELDVQAIQKKGYEHFLIKEIFEQPRTLRSTLAGRLQLEEGVAKLGGPNLSDAQLRNIKHLIIVGCGTANYAGQLASYYIEKLTDDITIEVVVASEYRYRSFNVPEGTVALFISQSGETADTLACLSELKRRGIRCLGIINSVGSTIAREVDGGVYLHVGAEISVASTKAFTSQVAAMVLLGMTIAQAKGAKNELLHQYVSELNALPDEIERILKEHHDEVKTYAKKYSKYEHAIFIGRDTSFPIALEGALKLKEISYIQAEGYPSGELKHGPIALIDDRFFEIALVQDNWLFEKSISNVVEINTRGAHVLAITDSRKKIEAEATIRISTHLKLLTPLLFNVLLQLFAYHVAVEKGNDVDQPRNLAKSVTVE